MFPSASSTCSLHKTFKGVNVAPPESCSAGKVNSIRSLCLIEKRETPTLQTKKQGAGKKGSISSKMANITSNGSVVVPPSMKVPAATTIVSVTLLILIMTLSIFGNTLVCVACVCSKRLQNFPSVFIVSLAISDLLVGVVSAPVWISIQLDGQPSMVSMPTLYILWLCMDILCGTASIMNLVFISIDRFLAVCYPLSYQAFMSRGKVTMAIIFLWGYAFVISGLYPLRLKGYALVVAVSAFLAPLLILIIAYSKILKVASTHARLIRAQSQSTRSTGSLRFSNFRQDLKAARTLSIVMGTFFLCWCPFFVLNIVSSYCRSCSVTFSLVVAVKLLHYGNSACNPVIYGCLNKHFRSAFKVVLQNAFNRVPCVNAVGGLEPGVPNILGFMPQGARVGPSPL